MQRETAGSEQMSDDGMQSIYMQCTLTYSLLHNP